MKNSALPLALRGLPGQGAHFAASYHPLKTFWSSRVASPRMDVESHGHLYSTPIHPAHPWSQLGQLAVGQVAHQLPDEGSPVSAQQLTRAHAPGVVGISIGPRQW